LSNSFVTPILTYIDFSYYFLIIRRKFVNVQNSSQRDLNALFENPQMDIALRYSYIFKTLLGALFFNTLFPLGGLIGLLGIFLTYIIDKVLLISLLKKN